MKKLFFLLFICIFFASHAQNFQLTNHDGVPYSDGQTISETITEEDLNGLGEFVMEVVVQNLTGMELLVKTLRNNISLPTGMFAYVCFGVCDDSGETAMDWTIDGKSEIYALHLKPNGITGLCKFKIDFKTPEQNMTLYIDIKVLTVGVPENNNSKVSLSAFPNPATVNSKVNINYTLADKNSRSLLVIRNIVGAEVLSMPLNSNENNISVETANLLPGIYFYAIENKNQIAIAKKLIVK